MKTFNYHSAKDVKEASKLASSNSAFLAGGMTTIPSMKLGLASYKDIIDIKRIKKLSGIKVSGKTVTIGATTKHSEVANSKDVKKTIKKLTELRLRNKVILEASGRINSKNIARYARTNVDMISVGNVTNSVEGIDLSLEIS